MTATTDNDTILMQSMAQKQLRSVQSYKRTLVETSSLLQSLKSHQQALDACVQGSHSLYFLFSCLMKSVSAECSQYSTILSNIKCELEIAKQNNRFDIISVFEILESSKQLLKYSKIIEQQNRLIQKSIANFIELVTHEKKTIEENFSSKVISAVSRNLNATGIGIATMTAAATVTALDMASRRYSMMFSSYSSGKKSAVMGTIIGAVSVTGTVLGVIDYCKNNKVDDTLKILNKLQKKLFAIQSSSDQFALLTNKVVDNFINYTNSADKNVAYLFQTGTRPTALATKMIKETSLLQGYFEKIESEASKNAKYFLTLEHNGPNNSRKKY